MSEKRYLLTESDIDRIKRLECGWCVENAGGDFDRAESSAAEQARFLEAHEYRESEGRPSRDEAHHGADSLERLALDMLACINEKPNREAARFALRLIRLGVDGQWDARTL